MAIRTGEKLLYQGAVVRVVKLESLEQIKIQDQAKQFHTVSRKELSAIPEETEIPDSDEIFALSDKEFADAAKLHDTILPILNAPGDGSVVGRVSKESKIPVSTLYRLTKIFREIGTIDSLAENRGKALKGRKLIDPLLEKIVTDAIESKYLKPARKSKTKVIEEVNLQCKKKNLKPPHSNTIRKRLAEIDVFQELKKRYGGDKANDKLGARPGEFPDPVHALQVAQIDHTPINCLVYDPVYKKPIKGRLYLTTAMDVVTRMILGYYLSFFKPGFVNAGLCLSHAILPKEETLKRLNIPGTWPCWGKMQVLYMDNAKEFRGESMARACKKHRIHRTWRPRKNPRFSGHIESFQKTLNEEIHNLPGSTFHNPIQRDNYDSESTAALTFEEIEAFIVEFIVNNYHVRAHSQTKRPPIAMWEEQIVGNKAVAGIGYQDEPDEKSVKINFLPSFFRSIQNSGVTHEGIPYYSTILKPFIKREQRGRGKKLKEYEFRWDPRDLSKIHFWHPERKAFEPVELANVEHHNIKTNIWEYKATRQELIEQGKKEVDSDRIFASIERNNQRERDAVDRKQQEKAQQKKTKLKNSETKSSKAKVAEQEDDPFAGIDIESIKAFN